MKRPARTDRLTYFQEYVAETEKERGFDKETALEKCLLLGEEVGELFKAVRRHAGIKTDPSSDVHEIGNELADILNFVLAIANRFDVDLAQAYAHKETLNNARSWTRS